MISKLIIAVLLSVALSIIVSTVVFLIFTAKIARYIMLKMDSCMDKAINEMFNQKDLFSNVHNKEEFIVKKGEPD